MPLSTAQKLQAYGVDTESALELQRQFLASRGNTRRLQALGMIPKLADYVAGSITSGTFTKRIATELSMDSVLALKIAPFIVGPRNTVLPTITGTAKVGQTLTSTNGTWTGSPTFTRHWYANGVIIPAATAVTYVPVSGDIGKTVTVIVSGTAQGNTVSATSLPTAAVIA